MTAHHISWARITLKNSFFFCFLRSFFVAPNGEQKVQMQIRRTKSDGAKKRKRLGQVGWKQINFDGLNHALFAITHTQTNTGEMWWALSSSRLLVNVCVRAEQSKRECRLTRARAQSLDIIDLNLSASHNRTSTHTPTTQVNGQVNSRTHRWAGESRWGAAATATGWLIWIIHSDERSSRELWRHNFSLSFVRAHTQQTNRQTDRRTDKCEWDDDDHTPSASRKLHLSAAAAALSQSGGSICARQVSSRWL